MVALSSKETTAPQSAKVAALLRLQSLALEAAANAIVITDVDAVIQWANPAFSALTGYSLEETVGKRPQDLMRSGLHSRAYYQAMWQTIKSGAVWRGEVINRRKDGTLYSEALTITPVLDDEGEVAHFIAVKEDISARKRLEQRQLAQSRLLEKTTGDLPLTALLEELIRFIEEQAPELRCSILLADEGRGVLVHGAAPSLPDAYNQFVDGLPIREGCGSCGTAAARGARVISRDVHGDPLWAPYLRSIAEMDGMDWLCACWSTPFFDSRGRLLGTFALYPSRPEEPSPEQSELIAYAVALARLVVERKQANEALRQNERTLATILDSVEAYIYIKDADLLYRYANRAVCELFGRPLEDVVGRGDEIFFDAATVARLHENDRRVLVHGERCEVEEFNTGRASGQTRAYLSVKLPLRDEEGRIYALCGISTDITERKRLENALQESEQRLRTAIQAGNIGLWDCDLRTCQVFYSSEWKRQIGYDDDEIGNDLAEWTSRIHPDDLEPVLRTVREFIDAPLPDYRAEFRFRHKNGAYRWILTQASLLRDQEGKPARMLGAHIDITERKQAEESLREKEYLLSESQRISHVGSWQIELPTWKVTWSEEGYRIYGISPETFRHDCESFCQLIHADDRAAVREWVKAILAGERPGELEFRVIRPDGGRRILSGRGELQRDDGQRPVCMIGTVQDITERRLAEETLRASETRFRNLFEQASDGIFLISADNRYLEANSRGQEMLGYTREELLGLEVAAVLAPHERPRLAVEVPLVMAGRPHLAEWEHLRKDGSTFPAEASVRRLDDRSFMAVVRDLTGRKQAEARLLNLNRVYTVLSNINQAIVRLRDLDQLFQETCRIAVEDGGFRMAWIGVPDRDARQLCPVARFGEIQEYLDALHIALDDGEYGRGPSGTAFRENRHVCCNDIEHDPSMEPWRMHALRLGFRASIAIPITVKDRVRGVFNLYSEQAGFFTAEEIRLLDELANDIAFAMEVAESEAERRRSEERLHQAAVVFESTREGVMVTDPDQRIVMVNRAFTEITGYTEAEVLDKTPWLLSSGRHDEDFYAALWASIEATGHWQGDIWNRRKNGEMYPELLSISVVKDARGTVTGYVGVFADISKLKSTEAELEFLAHHDPLTRLPNRLLLLSRLDHGIELARRENGQLALLMVDLDHFKDINDSFGHPSGDELLQQVASQLTARLRRTDTVSRLGGDEFTVLLENVTHAEDAARVADEIISTLSEPRQLANRAEVQLGVSIGISLFPQHGDSATDLLQHADAALYQAKAEGRGRFKYFSEDLTRAARERIDLEARLRRAILRDELRVFYQPQVDIASGQIIGAEALVRWEDPEQGLLPPSRFIPAAEATGLISTVGEWVLKKACIQGQRWIEAGLPPLSLAVNVSPQQFARANLAAVIELVLAETGFPSDRLELELTESTLMERQREAVDMLDRLRTIGVRLAIDDFGIGYSSLAYLKRFPLDVLKIDKSFVDDLPHGDDDREIATTIIAMARTLGLKVLAEGVETAAQLAFLKDQGCDFYQGYLKSPPLPAAAFQRLLQGRS